MHLSIPSLAVDADLNGTCTFDGFGADDSVNIPAIALNGGGQLDGNIELSTTSLQPVNLNLGLAPRFGDTLFYGPVGSLGITRGTDRLANTIDFLVSAQDASQLSGQIAYRCQ